MVNRAEVIKSPRHVLDDTLFTLGNDNDVALVLKSGTLNANTALTGVAIGTPVAQALPVNSAILSNTTADGDVLMLVNDGGNSKEFLFVDGSEANLVLGHGMATATVKTASGVLTLDSGAAINIEPASGSAILLDGTISIDAGVVTGVTALTSATVDATTDFTIGDTVITDGVITDSSGLQLAANLDINGTADISGILTMSAGDIDLNNQGGILNVGVSGNDWSANSLAHASVVDAGTKAIYLHNTSEADDAATRALLDIIVNGGTGDNLTGDPLITVRVTGGENWALGVDNDESDRFVIANDNGLGSHDCIRITSDKAISFDDANASYTTFSSDYACDGCGKTAISMFECCGTVAWHDDVLALRELQLSPQGLQHMAKLGVYEIDGPDDAQPGAAFINYQKATKYTWAGMYQNRARMDAQYEQLNERLEAIGA